jgi:ParB family protein of integrating conjugative element (PFGI_1 class)
MASKLLTPGFTRTAPTTTTLSDPLTDTPMVVTLDQLRPYDHDPRVMRNPAYEDIKTSIRERGLDSPPAITRRPGAEHFIVRNGGNTRLAILRDLWNETRQEQFFRITCLFRPWSQRGEIVALTGHLAENEVRGGLTFIERALGIEKAREFYEQENGKPLSQAELAKRLTADGLPVNQSHISRARDAVQYLLPAIPTVLYGGLGRSFVERLIALHNAAERLWRRHAANGVRVEDFDVFFQGVLMPLDTLPDSFSIQLIQDALIEKMSGELGIGHDVLRLEMIGSAGSENRLRVLPQSPGMDMPLDTPPVKPEPGKTKEPRATDERERMAARTPAQVSRRDPIAEAWHIDPGLDSPVHLRREIAGCARDIADGAGLNYIVAACDDGIGFHCTALPPNTNGLAREVWALLTCLSWRGAGPDGNQTPPVFDFARLLHGFGNPSNRLSDAAMFKLFRLIRLARRLAELEIHEISSTKKFTTHTEV